MQSIEQRPFYVVSLTKLALLFFATQGAFALVWFFLHWQAQNATHAKKVLSVPRAFFNVFYIGSLCTRLLEEQRKRAVEYFWSPMRLSAVFILVSCAEFAIALAIHGKYLSTHWQFAALGLKLPEFYVLYQFQLVANRVVGDPFGKANNTISGVNALWIGFGVFMWMNLLWFWFSDAPAPTL